jgi:hypothetical protein
MQVFKFKLQQEPEVYHTLAVDRMDAVLDICEMYSCTEADITDLQTVEKLSARRPKATQTA